MLQRLIITAVMCWMIFASCSLENKGIRSIRGHTLDKQGIAHGAAALHAERYCQFCHGPSLLGGKEAQPSCYQCHGQRWAASEPAFVFAPSTHSVDRGGYLHHEALDQVNATCTQCHGSDLQGVGLDGPPSCFLCHEQVWSE